MAPEKSVQTEQSTEQSQVEKTQPEILAEEKELLGEPDLPRVPDEIRTHMYKESGNTSLSAILFGVISGTLITFILAFLAYVAIELLIYICVDFMINDIVAGGRYKFKFIFDLIFYFFTFVFMQMIYFGTGYSAGYVTKEFMRFGSNRNNKICNVIALVSSLSGYIIFVYIGISTLRLWDAFNNSTWNQFLIGNSYWVYIEQTIAVIVIIFSAFFASKDHRVYCEKCGQWYKKSAQDFFDYSVAELLLKALTSDSPQIDAKELSAFKPRRKIDNQVGLNIAIWQCPDQKNNHCDANIIVENKYRLRKMVKGVTKEAVVNDLWFNTMTNHLKANILLKNLFK